MISHKHKTIFIHVPKIAGISIEQMYLEELGLDFNNRASLLLGINTNNKLGPPRVSHLTAKEYVENHYISDEIFNEYYKFGLVRNPYDRVYSFYKYLGFNNIISFETFVKKYLEKIFLSKQYNYFLQPIVNYVCIEGKLVVNDIFKLENIKVDLEVVFEKTNLKKRQLPHANNSEELNVKTKLKRIFKIIKMFPEIFFDLNFKGKDKGKSYNTETKKIVQNLYNEDFKQFNYDI